MGPCSNTLDWVPGVFGLCLLTERQLGVQQWKDLLMPNQCDQSVPPASHSVLHRFVTREGLWQCLKSATAVFRDQIVTTVCNGQLWLSFSTCLIFPFMLLKATSNTIYQLCVSFHFSFQGHLIYKAHLEQWSLINQYIFALFVCSRKSFMVAPAKGVKCEWCS